MNIALKQVNVCIKSAKIQQTDKTHWEDEKLLNNANTIIIIFTLPPVLVVEGREVTAEEPQIKSQSTEIRV